MRLMLVLLLAACSGCATAPPAATGDDEIIFASPLGNLTRKKTPPPPVDPVDRRTTESRVDAIDMRDLSRRMADTENCILRRRNMDVDHCQCYGAYRMPPGRECLGAQRAPQGNGAGQGGDGKGAGADAPTPPSGKPRGDVSGGGQAPAPLRDRLAAREGGPLLREANGHLCYGHALTDRERELGVLNPGPDGEGGMPLTVPMTRESCLRLLETDLAEARGEALAVFDRADDPLLELCFWSACRSRFGHLDTLAQVADAVEGDAGLAAVDRRRARLIARRIRELAP